MKNKIKHLSIALFCILQLISCSRGYDNTTEAPAPSATVDPINNFVWRGLNSWYYWQKDVPNLADSFGRSSGYANFINGKTPDNLFYSLLNDYPRTDRFSWIVSDLEALNQQFSGISKDSGMNISLYYKDAAKVGVVGIINYVVPSSPAASAGLERGDVISEVNSSALTTGNYRQLFSDSFSVTIAQNVSVSSSGVATSGEKKKVNIAAVTLQENPVAFYRKYEVGGKKIGYLVYNGFQSIYNDELNAAFGQMKADQVGDLILDLRYNGGGSVESAIALGQMITGGFTGQPYVVYDFNDKHNQYDETANLSSTVRVFSFVNGQAQATGSQQVNSLNLNKVYVLTSQGTASASELTIMGLRAYINVVTVGAETYGKFVGSITLYDHPASDFTSFSSRNQTHKWAMQPIVFSYFNGKRQPNPLSGGIVPNEAIDSYSYLGNLKEFGNTSDPALSKAIEMISGVRLNRKADRSPLMLQNEFVGSNRTFKKFGTEMYIENINR